MHIVCVLWPPTTIFMGTTSEESTHCAIDEDPQKFSSNGLQLLAIVQLSQDNFVLQDMVLQYNPEQTMIHGHHLV